MGLATTEPHLRDAEGDLATPFLDEIQSLQSNTEKENTKMSEQVFIFDTTLRDGEQSPGAALNIEEKMQIAQQLERLNVDVIEAGFPISSPEDFESVSRIAAEIEGPEICGLSRVLEPDITRCWEAVKHAQKPRNAPTANAMYICIIIDPLR